MRGIKIAFTSEGTGFAKGLAEMRGKYKKFTDFIKENRTAFSLGFAAAGVTALTSGFTKATDKASRLSAMAKEAKINVEGLQVALLLADKEGATQEQVVAALKNINSRTIDAKNGATNYEDALERLNIDLQTFLKLNTEQKLQQIAKGYMQTGEDAQAYRDILLILGEDAGPKMIGVLQKMGTDGFDQLNQKMKESGKILKEDVVEGLKLAEDAAKSARQEFTGRLSTGMGRLALLAGFGKREDVLAMRSTVADGLTGGVFDFVGKDAEAAGKEEERQIRLRRQIAEQDRIIAESQAEINRITGGQTEKPETRKEQLERIANKAQVRKDNKAFVDGIFTEGRKMATIQGRDRQKLINSSASIPASSIQAIGGGGNVSNLGVTQIQILKTQESILREIAKNTSMMGAEGPIQNHGATAG